MAEPPASGWAMRGATLVGASFETVASGAVSGVLLLDELDCALRPEEGKSREDARHSERTRACRWKNDFVGKDTI